MKMLLTIALCCSSIFALNPIQDHTWGDSTAMINAFVGVAVLRYKGDKSETKLTSARDLFRSLFPDQEIRCEKNCQLELLLCTGKKVLLSGDGSWYRIPALACSPPKFVPGQKSFLQPGGRATVSWLRENQVAVVGAFVPSRVARQSAVSRNQQLFPGYRGTWYFRYPYEGAAVLPNIFEFDIPEVAHAPRTQLHVFMTLSVFDENVPHLFKRQQTFEFKVSMGLLTTIDDRPYSLTAMRDFMSADDGNANNRASRVYCFITTDLITSEVGWKPEAHSFGFEFTILSRELQQVSIDGLNSANNETGISRLVHLGDFYARLGMIKQARFNYGLALKEAPQNTVLAARWKELNDLIDVGVE